MQRLQIARNNDMTKFSISIKIFMSLMGLWLMIYLLTKLIQTVTTREKFELEKYKNVIFFPRKNESIETLPYHLLPKKDYNELIGIPFNFTILNSCNGESPLLLVLVDSAPNNFINRTTVRESWGRKEDDVKILFVLGATTSPEIQKDIIKENEVYKDIIQGSFIDAYRNLTYKHQMDLKYVVYHCPLVKYAIKTDDDVFINIPFMKNFLIRDISPYGAHNLVMGYVIHNARSFRSYRSKWRVTFEEYPHRRYPTYCLGWLVVYTPDTAFKFYQGTQKEKFFWIDDVLITGIVGKKIHFGGYVDIAPLTLTKHEVYSLINATHKYRPFLFGPPDMHDEEIRYLWKYVINSPIPESVQDDEN